MPCGRLVTLAGSAEGKADNPRDSSIAHGRQEIDGVLTGQYGNYGLPPSKSSFFIHALVASHYLDGGAYPVGGASRLAMTILPVIESAGGAVYTNAEVRQILVEDDRAVGVRLADGNELRAPLVVSDVGASNTFRRLLPNEVTQSTVSTLC